MNAALEERRPTPIGFRKTSPRELRDGFLESVRVVQNLALRTEDRYRAALTRFVEFCEASDLPRLDVFGEREIERFVAWLRKQTRARNGAKNGKQAPYAFGGIKFILSTCRTAFAWALRQRMLPPYAPNPFQTFNIDRLRARDGDGAPNVLSPEQERAFFAACDDWQRPIFRMLATYGLRVGELTHLLVEDVDVKAGALQIRSKPEMFWLVKTRRQRTLPLTTEVSELLRACIGSRKAGFVFLQREFAAATRAVAGSFANDRALRAHLVSLAEQVRSENESATERDLLRAVTTYCRLLGQIPERAVRTEFMALTEKIGCPEFTRVHDLRHLFSSRAQELGLNPLLVQDLLGHATLEMTRRYTHLGIDAKREALQRLESTPPR